jgi:PAS domain S-box-containing protein
VQTRAINDPWFEHAPLALALVGDDFRFLAANRRFCELVRRSWDDLGGRTYGELTQADDLGLESGAWLGLARGGGELRVEKRFIRGDGSLVRASVRASAMPADSALAGILLSAERVETAPAASTAERSEVLERARRDLEFVAGFASHDLRQHTRMVASFIGATLQHQVVGLDAKSREYLELALASSRRLGESLAGLVDYLRLGLARGALAIISSGQALDAALVDLRDAIAGCGALVTREGLPELSADQTQLCGVFRQLLDNALVHRGTTTPRIHVRCQREGGDWRFSVSDAGPGIPAALRERVFQPFFTTLGTPPGQRLGLGLAFCRAAVERHGGRIWIDDAPAGGTTVSFLLPAG